MTKAQAIQQIETSFPSIWSREDVLSLVNQIDKLDYKDNGNVGFDKDKLIKKIREAVDNSISNMGNDEIVDMSDCEFNIRNGNEIEIDSFNVNTNDIVDNVMTDVEEAIDEYIEENQSQEA